MNIQLNIFLIIFIASFSVNSSINNFLNMSIIKYSGVINHKYTVGFLGLGVCGVAPLLVKFINLKNELNSDFGLLAKVNHDLIKTKLSLARDKTVWADEYCLLRDKLGLFPYHFFLYSGDINLVDDNNKIVKKIICSDEYKNKNLTIEGLKKIFIDDDDFLKAEHKEFITNYIDVFFSAVERYYSKANEKERILIFLNFFNSERFLISSILGKESEEIQKEIELASKSRENQKILLIDSKLFLLTKEQAVLNNSQSVLEKIKNDINITNVYKKEYCWQDEYEKISLKFINEWKNLSDDQKIEQHANIKKHLLNEKNQVFCTE